MATTSFCAGMIRAVGISRYVAASAVLPHWTHFILRHGWRVSELYNRQICIMLLPKILRILHTHMNLA